ncbi:MAG: type IV toxin-antitoxin system AbiEi family antitoxin [Bacteroidota bacterium]|nr:type IV toxin-antitoxin system AbiEi family antitoxin [Bacteroidota bacterium]
MKYKVITDKAAQLLKYLTEEGKEFFTVKDVNEFLKDSSKSYTKKLLREMTERELVMRLKSGLYVQVPYDTPANDFFPNWGLVGSKLIGDANYYIGYFSALKMHGFTTQPSIQEQVVSDKRMKPAVQKIRGVQFQFIYHTKKQFIGNKKVWTEALNRSFPVLYSDLEKTIIDCLYKPDYAFGIVEVAKAIYLAKDKIKPDKLIYYIKQLGSQAVIKRLGFILELYEIDFPIIEDLQQMKSASYVALDPIHPKRGKTTSRWRVFINVDINTIKQAPFS